MTTEPITEREWRKVMDMVWQGCTLFQAAAEIGIDGMQLDYEMSEKMRRYMLDIGVMVNYREDLLTEMRLVGEPTTAPKYQIANLILQRDTKND